MSSYQTYLAVLLTKLNDVLQDNLSDSEIAEIKGTIEAFAITAAVSGAVAGMVPGFATVVAVLTQTGLVWATYVKINKTLGISISENAAKFIGAAILTNLATNAGVYLAGIVTAAVFSFIPVLGQIADVTILGIMGFVTIYVSTLLYLKLIVRWVKPDGSLQVEETEETKKEIADLVKESDLKGMIKEGKNEFKKAKSEGKIDEAKKNPKCPNCQADIQLDQEYCPQCGMKLK